MSRAAVVTGGASGMGSAICRQLAAMGHPVGVLDIDAPGARRVAAELQADGGVALALEADITDDASVDAALRSVRAELGPVAIMATSAGIAPYDAFGEITRAAWDRVLAVDLTGTFVCVQAAVPDMMAAGWGRIVTISSAAGQWGTARMAHYSAAKGGVIALTKALAREVGSSGITVNTIAPGAIDTPMSERAQADGDLPSDAMLASRVPLGRKGTAEEIAATCAFLCSDAAAYITGQVIGVNGGMVI